MGLILRRQKWQREETSVISLSQVMAVGGEGSRKEKREREEVEMEGGVAHGLLPWQ